MGLLDSWSLSATAQCVRILILPFCEGHVNYFSCCCCCWWLWVFMTDVQSIDRTDADSATGTWPRARSRDRKFRFLHSRLADAVHRKSVSDSGEKITFIATQLSLTELTDSVIKFIEFAALGMFVVYNIQMHKRFLRFLVFNKNTFLTFSFKLFFYQFHL